MKLHPASLLALVLSMALAGHCRAVEAWADQRLEVTEGLELWLDASRLATADAAPGGQPPRDRQPVGDWPDASGHHRDATQSQPARRPQFRDRLAASGPGAMSAGAAIYFDGRAAGMTVHNGCGELADFTLFVVAAPYSNLGRYRGLFSCDKPGVNDYQSGLNVDLGKDPGTRCGEINVEGAGFGGEKNLLNEPLGLGTFHVFSVECGPAGGDVRLLVDGRPRGSRPRAAQSLRADEMRIGMRYYGQGAEAPADASFFDGCVAEVLLYRRALPEGERRRVEAYLRRKHAGLLALTALPAAPPVQMLVSGFAVRELPVKLTNINCVAYGPDGLLYALGYDGRIHVLRDTDGDGIEDRADVWWDKPTLRTPVAMAWRPEGLYVVSNGKISLFRDSKHAGAANTVADTEEVVVTGWPKDAGRTGGNVDALGIAFDSDNNLYFGLGCADYSNPYLVQGGQPHYDLHGERGTILKVSPDRKRREVVCTGIRFPYSIAFNKAGDLFCTDQEGETWCPGGNPLDELNFITPGRHYGFPPRHPQYLPDVRDEPPVVGFGPQHQSTCGFAFDEPAPGRPLFGPAAWEGDAIVAGFSRGKLWRVRLAKTPTGYVGRETLIAALRLLTLSPAVSPSGDLVVACHGGLPDWGSGPRGDGKLFKIRYADRDAPRPTPQPLQAWARSAAEVCVAFDRPVDPGWIDTSGLRITYGEHVRAGDRFESLRPGYATVEAQSHAFRGELRVAGATLSEDRRTLHVTTDPHPMQAWYALTIPLRPPAPSTPSDGQEPVIELAYDLSGVDAQWTPEGQAVPAWSGWLPHADLDVARRFTAGSVEHERLFQLLHKPGTLRLSASLRPAEPQITVRCEGATSVELRAKSDGSAASASGRHAAVACDARRGPVEVTVSLRTGQGGAEGSPPLHVSSHTADDPAERPLPLAWQYPAWAPRSRPAAPPAGPDPDLAGGDWKRGRDLFFGTEANCSACHTVRGKGGRVGPDLSNLSHRDAASVLRDIVDPNAAVNPDHVAYTLTLNDGRVLFGLVRSEGADDLRVTDAHAADTVVRRGDVVKLQASPISIMPEGYAKLGEPRLKDLITFLTTAEAAPPAPPKITAPPPRTRAEVDAALKALPEESNAPRPARDPRPPRTLHIVLVAGPKDHGPGEHDYPAWQKR